MPLDEKVLGLMTSVLGSAVTNGVHYAARAAGVTEEITIPVIVIAFGNLVALYLDVLLAKRDFHDPSGAVIKGVRYTNFRFRNAWFAEHLVGSVGLKYFVVALFDGVIVYHLYRIAQRWLNERGFMKDRALVRDVALASLTSVVTFLAFANFLRFNWAFQHRPSTAAVALTTVVGVAATAFLVDGRLRTRRAIRRDGPAPGSLAGAVAKEKAPAKAGGITDGTA
jgi:hypothetical protein